MRQKITGHMTGDHNSKKAESQPKLAPAVFNKNQNSALCLPLLSKNQKVIWVHSDEISLPVEKAAKLDEAFSKFPYLTQKQTVLLAQHCCLHPDQVKVWFIAQRLCYGISWDSKDINEVKKKMVKGTTLDTQHKCEKKMTITPMVTREDEGDTVEEIASNAIAQKKLSNAVRDDPMIAENMESKGKGKKTLKRKEISPHTILKKPSQMSWPKEETPTPDPATLQKAEGDCIFAIPDESLDRSPSVTFRSQDASSDTSSPLVEKEKTKNNNQPPQKQMITQSSQTFDLVHAPDKKLREKKKRRPLPKCTPKQLGLMKIEFIKEQYPTSEQYQELSSLSGVPRYALVQWFNDMRYITKKCKPRWMNEQQHKKAVANIMREQCLRKKMKRSLKD